MRQGPKTDSGFLRQAETKTHTASDRQCLSETERDRARPTRDGRHWKSDQEPLKTGRDQDRQNLSDPDTVRLTGIESDRVAARLTDTDLLRRRQAETD